MKKLYLYLGISIVVLSFMSNNFAFAQEVIASSIEPTSMVLDEPSPQPELLAEMQTTSPDSTQNTTPPKVTTEQDLKKEEHQRIVGVVPNFNVSYNFKAPPLTKMQKLSLTMHTNLDPVVFATAAFAAGRDEVFDDFQGYGWGPEGYFKRWGAEYADTFDGNLIGNALLPIVLHQDPRYFRMGTGSIKKRILYSISTTFVCRGDNGKRQPNVSNILGNFIAGGISNAYYPSSDRGVGLTFQNAITVTAEGSLGGLFDEFWPDISHRLFKKHPKLAAPDMQETPMPSPKAMMQSAPVSVVSMGAGL